MSLGTKGEGGIIVLKGILLSILKEGPLVPVIGFLAIIGISLFIGDGVITPAISILSAVEGIRLVPGFASISGGSLLIIAAIIAIVLFFFQKRGTENIAWAFGPVMFVWFLCLAVTGIISISHAPQVLLSLNPYYAITFLLENGFQALFVLSAVILCFTGGEALYADMGQLGRDPIVKGWYFVFPSLMLSYLGQGAYVLNHGPMGTVLFHMVASMTGPLYIPFLILSIGATIIASQAMISGMFAVVYQAVTTRILPKMKIQFTSSDLMSQIYIDGVNWLLLAAVLIIMVAFKTSENLAAAYGVAVAGNITISAIMLMVIFLLKKESLKFLISVGLIIFDATFFIASLTKLPHGAYWSFLLASVPFFIIIIFTRGQEKLRSSLSPIPLDQFLPQYREGYSKLNKISGAALYFISDPKYVSPYVTQIFFENEIIYEQNIFVSIRIRDYPFGLKTQYKEECAEGLYLLIIDIGYMEIIDIESLIRERGINEKTIFYGMENIVSDRIIWKIYGVMKRLSPPFVQFYSLPSEKIHGVITRIIL